MRRPLLLGAGLALVLATVGCKGADPGRRGSAPPIVRTMPVEGEELERVVEITGTLSGQEEVTVSAEVAGKVEKIFADLGDPVGEGAPIVQLDRTELRLQVAQAESEFLQALARLGIDGAKLDHFDPATQADVRRAQADLDEAQRNLARGEELLGRNLLAQGEVDTLRTRARVAEASFQQALESARSSFALAKGRRASLGLARKKLQDASVASPIRGVIAKRLVSLGEFISQGQPVAVVVMTDPLKLQAEVPERYVGQIAKGMQVSVEVSGLGRHQGSISRVGPLVSSSSRTFPIEALFENEDGALQPGLFAQGTIALGTEEKVFSIPETAISSVAGVHKVFVLEDGKARVRSITILRKRGGDALVQGDLQSGETLILTAIARLYDGAEVTVDDAPSANAERF